MKPNVFRGDSVTGWYVDGVEHWGLDGPDFQVRLFAAEDAGHYHDPRLFIERDRRDAAGRRVDYACKSWPLTEPWATRLLESAPEVVLLALKRHIAEVMSLPCQSQYCSMTPAGPTDSTD